MILGQWKVEKSLEPLFVTFFLLAEKFRFWETSSKMRVSANTGWYVRAVKTSEDVLRVVLCGRLDWTHVDLWQVPAECCGRTGVLFSGGFSRSSSFGICSFLIHNPFLWSEDWTVMLHKCGPEFGKIMLWSNRLHKWSIHSYISFEPYEVFDPCCCYGKVRIAVFSRLERKK